MTALDVSGITKHQCASCQEYEHTQCRECVRQARTDTPTAMALRDAAVELLLAVDNAAFYALDYAEDGDEEPEWQTRLWDAADHARKVITP